MKKFRQLRIGRLYFRIGLSDLRCRFAELVHHANKLGDGPCFHLLHRAGPVHLDRDLAQADFRGNLLVEKAARDEVHDFPFAGGQRCITISERHTNGVALSSLPIARDRLSNGIKQSLLADRLQQEFDRAMLHGLDGHGNVAVSSDEDDREGIVGFDELPLEVETARGRARKSDIEHEAGRYIGWLGAEKFIGGAKRLRIQIDRAAQVGETGPNERIVIDDKDNRVTSIHAAVLSGSSTSNVVP